MRQFSILTLGFFRVLGITKEVLEESARWATTQAPEAGKPADLFLAKLREKVPDSPEKLVLFATDAWREWTGEDPGYSDSGGLGSG